MTVHTITVTYGTAAGNASTSTACIDLAEAMRNAERAATFADHTAPLMSILIRVGDFAPRLRSGAWVDAPADGWPDPGYSF